MSIRMLCVAACLCLQTLARADDAFPPVIIDYFYEPGCPECGRVSGEVMPDLNARYEGFYRIERHDTGITSNVIKLIAYQKTAGVEKNSAVTMFVATRMPFAASTRSVAG